MHYYQFNIANYRKKTGYLNLIDHAIYRSLIDTYYLEESPLSTDIAYLMRTHSIRNATERESFNMILTDFFRLELDGYHHDECDDVLSKIYAKSEKARESAMKRWNKHANALPTDSEGTAKAMLPINLIPINPLPNKDIGDKSPAKAKRFVEPSLVDVQNYFLNKTENRELARIEGEKFHAYYSSNGWKVGKNKMKSWESAGTGWLARNTSQGNTNETNQRTITARPDNSAAGRVRQNVAEGIASKRAEIDEIRRDRAAMATDVIDVRPQMDKCLR